MPTKLKPPSLPDWLVSPYLAAVMLTVIICASTWPGAMSWDPLWELTEARHGIPDGLYPPIGAYIFWLFDSIYPGPGLKFLAQNLIVFLSVAHIMRRLGYGSLQSFAALLFIALCPATLGTLVVVWKDTATAACLLLAIVGLLHAAQTKGRNPAYGFLGMALFFTYVAAAYRYNALAACFPLLAWMSDLLIRKPGTTLALKPGYLLRFTGVYVALLGVIVGTVWATNHYRLPDFKYLPSVHVIQANCEFDLIGMSRFSRQILVPDGLFPGKAKRSIETIDKAYHPEHWLYTRDSKELKRFDDYNYCGLFLGQVLQHPLAYIQHRLAVTNYLFAVTTDGAFLPTHEGIDENNLGVFFIPTRLSQTVYGYIKGMASSLARPWIYYVLATIILVIGIQRRARNWEIASLIYASGMLYSLLSLPVMPAGDLRYNMWPLIACMISSFMLLFSLQKPKKISEKTLILRQRIAYGGLFLVMLLAVVLAHNSLFLSSYAPRPLPVPTWKEVKPRLVSCLCGNLDEVRHADKKTVLSGWAYDVKANRAFSYVHVFVNGKHKYSLPVSGARPDVAKAQGNGGWSGFSVPLPEELKDFYVVVQRADGSFAKLYGQK